MNPVCKRPGYLFAKDFKFENVLGNLQGYKIATGQLEKSEIDEASKKYGADESLVFGSLITKAGETSRAGKRELNEETTNTTTKRRRKRRKRRRRKTNVDEKDASHTSTSTMACTAALSEPLSIPSSILAYGSSDNDSDASNHSKQDGKSSEESNLNSDEETSTDFFGLTDKDDTEIVSTEAEPTENKSTQGIDPLKYFESCAHPYPEVRTDMDKWDDDKQKYKENSCSLSTYKCWKCKRIGHLAEDCTVQTLHPTGADNQKCNKSLYQDNEDQVSPSVLKDYFKRCQILRNSKNSKCSECSAGSNLASCLDCGLVLCDGRGHLTNHLLSYPSHNKLYSFKLRRLIKCCKSTCGAVDATKLFMCSTCLSKQFNSHYNMINATWSRSGLKGIPNTLACEQHFRWHRINCANTTEEPLLSQEKLENVKQHDGLLSEFYF